MHNTPILGFQGHTLPPHPISVNVKWYMIIKVSVKGKMVYD